VAYRPRRDHAHRLQGGNYDLHQSVEDPGTFFFYENWESSEHLDAHLGVPHLVHFAEIMADLLDENGLTINRLRRIA
jgi:quinol monooxygenase YgiN